MLRRLALASHRVMLRTARSPLRPLWSVAYRTLAHGVALGVGRGETSAAYVRAGFDDFLPGLSDVDMALVVPDRAARRRVMERWSRACRALPWLREIFDVAAYTDDVLADAASASTFTCDGPVYFGRAPLHDESSLRERPRPYGPLSDWRLLRGADRLPALPTQSAQDRRIAAWLELQAWWAHTFEACLDPSGPRKPYLSVKLVAEPARLWLWLVHGERIDRRVDVLRRALEAIPEEEQAIRAALALEAALPRRPDARFDESLPPFIRLTARIVERFAAEVRDEGSTEVRLVGSDSELDALPLADWRAVVRPSIPDERFLPVEGDPADPAVLASAQKAVTGPYPALRRDGLLVLPASLGLAELRGVQCELTDPVSFAVAEGRSSASFPNVPGWSARDWARRAVVEHGAWLADRRDEAELTVREWPDPEARRAAPAVRALGRFFTAGRAALFHQSVECGQPVLALTARAVAELIGAEGEYDEYREARAGGPAPSPAAIASMRRRVADLPAYARAAPELETAA